MVDYTKLLKPLREKYLHTVVASVELPPVKEDCTCVRQGMHLFNAPASYCVTCGNLGYLSTPVLHDVTGTVVDAASEMARTGTKIDSNQAYDFINQGYVFHADAADCLLVDETAALVGIMEGKTCFEVTKRLYISSVPYTVLSVDLAPMLNQYRVNIVRAN